MLPCFSPSAYPKFNSINSYFIQGPFISGSVLPLALCIFQNSCSNFSHPTCSSYISINIPPMKRYCPCSLPLNLSETLTIAEVMPHDFWGQDIKEETAPTQSSGDAMFCKSAAILWGSPDHMESPCVGVQQAKSPSWSSHQQPTTTTNMQVRNPLWWLWSHLPCAWKYIRDLEQELAEPSQSLNFERG